MKKKVNSNKLINGTHGAVWISTEKFANVKSFDSKVTLNYQDVDLAEDLATHKKYMGWSGAGTIVLHKVDSAMAKRLADGIKNGNLEPCTVVAKLDDPAANGAERVQLSGVYFDELTLLKFAMKEVQEEECPFTFDDYEFLDMIEVK